MLTLELLKNYENLVNFTRRLNAALHVSEELVSEKCNHHVFPEIIFRLVMITEPFIAFWCSSCCTKEFAFWIDSGVIKLFPCNFALGTRVAALSSMFSKISILICHMKIKLWVHFLIKNIFYAFNVNVNVFNALF